MPSPLRRAAGAALLVPTLGAAQALPTAASLMEKHNAAVGGRAALDRHSSMKLSATLTVPAQRLEAKMEMLRAKPNKIVTKTTIPSMGELTEGFDGAVGWALNPMGAQLMTGDHLDQVRDNADFYSSLQDPARYSKAETIELTDFEGKPCYKTRLTRGSRDAIVYFDAATGLLAGLTVSAPSSQGAFESTTIFAEYADFDGVRMPKRIESRSPQGTTLVVFESVEFDKVDPAAFDLPPSVRALVRP